MQHREPTPLLPSQLAGSRGDDLGAMFDPPSGIQVRPDLAPSESKVRKLLQSHQTRLDIQQSSE